VWSGWNVLVKPVEEALAADAVGGGLAMRIRTLLLGEADQRFPAGSLS